MESDPNIERAVGQVRDLPVSIRGGHLPPPDDNGVCYPKLPVDTL